MRLPHLAGSFDRELQDLTRRVAAMGGRAERMVGDAVLALVATDPRRAARVIAEDEALDDAERNIDETAVLLIARRQPLAHDLREIIAAINIAADLERIGDLAKSIAKRVEPVGAGHQEPQFVRGLGALSDRVLNQLKDVLDAYAGRNADRLPVLRERDREIDTAFASLFQEVVDRMVAEPQEITASTHLLFCIKNLERIGDHAAGIAETLHRMVTGEEIMLRRSEGSQSAPFVTGLV